MNLEIKIRPRFDLPGLFFYFKSSRMSRTHEQAIQQIITEATMTYSMERVCGVIFLDRIHFFGGESKRDSSNGIDYTQQHFGFDEKRNFIKYKDLGWSSEFKS